MNTEQVTSLAPMHAYNDITIDREAAVVLDCTVQSVSYSNLAPLKILDNSRGVLLNKKTFSMHY